jgi:hypothetical protein
VDRLKHRVKDRWSALGVAARLWWAALTTVGVAAVLVLTAATVVDASSHRASHPSASPTSASGSMAGMPGMAKPGSASGSGSGSSSPATPVPSGGAQAVSSTCANIKGATVMSDGMVMAPVPTTSPTAAQQGAANQLVARTKATLAKYASLSAATAAGYVPATNPQGRVVHYAHWQAARSDGFDPSNPAFLVYANTLKGPVLMGAMYLGPAPCTPGPDVGGSLTQWHAHDNLCLSGGRVVGRTSASGSCSSGTHNSSSYFVLHVWTEPSLAASHQFQADLTRAEVAPIILGTA